ncbi:transposase [Streptomyces sp. PTM05]|uniref:Transposase n=1 Tax=Streptantibioticus parmotrematis TaxID=2873249 RepID=A0ABS7QZN4_9ACTN|nr:transposase [Streptantibioticus parmotrematis]
MEVRHRGHATVENCIRCGKTTGFGRFPSRDFAINTAWLELSLAAIDLLAWMLVLLPDGELATAEPKKPRYRLLHVAARLTRGGRRVHRRISATWPWRNELADAFHRLDALPRPAGSPTPQLPAHNPKDPGEPDHRAGPPARPRNETTR